MPLNDGIMEETSSHRVVCLEWGGWLRPSGRSRVGAARRRRTLYRRGGRGAKDHLALPTRSSLRADHPPHEGEGEVHAQNASAGICISTSAPDFSVGVISFYSEQVTELHRQMARLRMTEEKEDGSYQIAEDWRTTRDSSGALKERLRIGTVDSFQGKEFDVVLLSVTRSNSLQASDEKARRRKFGHLMLANRLCVAMSRQKRLLIAAGDSGMLRSDGATEAIGALCKFYELCGGPHGRIVQA